jgi:hypothetical protein
MSEKTINIDQNGNVNPDPCPLSKSTEELYCNNHAPVAYELCFTNGSPFASSCFVVPAGAMHHCIGRPDNGVVGKSYGYDCVAKTESGAAADPTIIITR